MTQLKDNLITVALVLFFGTVVFIVSYRYAELTAGALSASAVRLYGERYLISVTVVSLLFAGIVSVALYRVARQRYRAHRMLTESEEKYRRVAEHAGIGIAVTRGGLLYYANPRLGRMLGYSIEGKLPRPFIQYIHPAYRKKALARYRRNTEDNRVTDFSGIVPVNDSRGQVRWFETNGVKIEWERGPAVLHFVRDVTEEKKVKEALVESEQLYRSLVESLNDVVFIMDGRGFITYISPVVESLSGLGTRQIVGRNYRTFVHPDDQGLLEERYIESIGEPYFSHEFRAIDGRGVIHHVRASVRVTVEGGIPVYVTGILTDISAHKLAEEALMQSEKRYRELVENLNDIIFVVDGQGNFRFINRTVEKITGHKPEEIIGKHYRSFVTEGAFREVEKVTAVSPRSGDFKTFEAEVYDTGEAVRIIECRMTPVWEDDRVVEFHVIGRDVTEKKELTRRLIQAEKLSSLGGILSGVAHELNNPLSAILGNAQLLMRKELPQDVREKLTVIEKESKRSTRIIGGLLAFARESKPERVMADINTVIEDTCRLMEYELRVNNVAMLTALGPDIPFTSLDPGQIQQVFINLITNAHHALSEKGGGNISIRSYHRENKIFIEFIDDGPGIAPENLKKIFDPFFTTKELGKGTGLGLSVVYGIVRQHAGRIDVKSKPGKGAVFTVNLPVVSDWQPDKEPETATGRAPGGRGSILVVDDEQSVRDFMAEVLTEEGYTVTTAQDGNEAIELIESVEFNAVVTNMKMPGLSGEDLYLSIRRKDPSLADRLIITTGDVLNEKTRNFLKITGNRFIEKPFEIDRLLTVVAEAVGQRS